ncbi:MAG: transposase [Aggregatilineales bacterium]
MNAIIALVACLAPYLSSTALRQLSQLIFAVLCIPGRVTTLGLSRWTQAGGSCRTLQRWYQTPLDWATLLWAVVQTHLLKPNGVYLLAGDAVVVSKAGHHTHGLGRFYSSLAGRAIPGLSFLAVSLIDVQARRSYPLQVEQQIVPSKAASADTPPTPKRPRGRPKGSKNHCKAPPTLSPELTLLERMLRGLTARITPLKVGHLVLDGAFGTYPATCMVRQCDLHLISKLHHNAALYWPYTGAKPRRGPTPRYGDRLDYKALPAAALCQTIIEGHARIDTYQLTLLHKDFPNPLNIVILVKTDLRTHRCRHVVLFSTDLSLSATHIVDYYSLRFQIEFNFRDAKQYWGLEDFMNVSPTAVTNAVNLAFLMVNLSAVLVRSFRQHCPDFSILDLKCHYRTQRYLHETIKLLPIPPDPDLIPIIESRLLAFGTIHPPELHRPAA